MEHRTVIYERKDTIGFISLNRPEKLNAQSTGMTRELLDAFGEAEADPGVRAIIFRGEGRAFCSGHDLAERTTGGSPEKEISDLETLQAITGAIMRMGKPVIAAVHGYALGVGCEWAMNCDVVVAAEGTKLGFPETSLGSAVSNGGTKLLPLLIGLARAKEMILSNRIIDAEIAERWGLVNRVVAPDALLSEATAVARKMAENPALAMKLAKSSINEALHLDIDGTLHMELNNIVLTSLAGAFDQHESSTPGQSPSGQEAGEIKNGGSGNA